MAATNEQPLQALPAEAIVGARTVDNDLGESAKHDPEKTAGGVSPSPSSSSNEKDEPKDAAPGVPARSKGKTALIMLALCVGSFSDLPSPAFC